jgi:uncharacterized protein (TIGR00251 family)
MVARELGERQVNITVQVQPNARSNAVLGFEDGVLHLKIAAPPVKGKANRELIEFLSKLLGVSRGSINIERGITGRRKVIAIAGHDPDKIIERIKRSGAKSYEDPSLRRPAPGGREL